MFDIHAVQILAHKLGYYEPVVFLEENRPAYVRFILTGEEQDDNTSVS